MARRPRDSRIDSRDARLKLVRREDPYWQQITPGVALGYVRGARGSVWRVRKYEGGAYRKGRLGIADDYADADGRTVLNHRQAVKAALEWAKYEQEPTDATVQEIADAYLEWHKAHSRAWKSTEYKLAAITDTLGTRKASALTTAGIQRWHLGLVDTKDEPESETLRKRKATANRLLTVFRAAMNYGWRTGMTSSSDAWRRVKPFKDVDAPRVRFLSEAECKRLINAAPADLRQLVRAALLTGCRYGELARLRVADFNANAATITIAQTKAGRTRHTPLTDEGSDFFEHATLGLKHDDLIFRRADGTEWKASNQVRAMLEACAAAKIDPPASFHVLRHTYASLLASNGVPLQIVAVALGHSDVRMTTRHYSHLRPDHVAEAIRANLPRFEKKKRSKVARLE
jgi:integrase